MLAQALQGQSTALLTACSRLQVLYHLQRGPLLGATLREPAEHAYLQAAFTASSAVPGLAMLSPSLLVWGPPAYAAEPRPLDTASLTSGKACCGEPTQV